MEYKLEKGDLHEDYKQCSEENSRCNMSDESNVDEEILNETEIKSKEFKSWNDAYEMYKKYGRRKGFGVRLHNIGRNKEKQITWRHFVCSSEGFRDKKYQENPDRKREQRNLTRSGCKASMRVQFNQERSLWFVSRFEDNHNHPLVGFNYTCFMRTHRSLTDADIAQVNSMRAAGEKVANLRRCYKLINVKPKDIESADGSTGKAKAGTAHFLIELEQRRSIKVFGKSTFIGLAITFFAGVCFSLFSPAFNLATNDQWHTLKKGVPHLSVYTAFFYFSVSCFVIAIILNITFLYYPVLNLPKSSLKAYLGDWNGRGVRGRKVRCELYICVLMM